MKADYSAQITKNLTRLRQERGLTQTELDRALGLREGRTGAIERGTGKMLHAEAIGYAFALEVPVTAFLAGPDAGYLNISRHWKRNRMIISELVRMLREFETLVEGGWVWYCQTVLEPYFRKLFAEGGKITEKNVPKPFWRVEIKKKPA